MSLDSRSYEILHMGSLTFQGMVLFFSSTLASKVPVLLYQPCDLGPVQRFGSLQNAGSRLVNAHIGPS